LVLSFYSGAGALTVLPLTEEELTKRATVILTGTVVDVHSDFAPDGSTIYTYIQVRVAQSLKGEFQEDVITLRQIGGSVGEKSVVLPGAPIYELGEEILIFAGPFGQTGYYGILGIFYGKYDIGIDPITGRKAVSGASFGIVHYDPDSLEPLPLRERPDSVYLDDFLSEIQSYL